MGSRVIVVSPPKNPGEPDSRTVWLLTRRPRWAPVRKGRGIGSKAQTLPEGVWWCGMQCGMQEPERLF